MKNFFLILALILTVSATHAIHFWQSYPINKTIIVNGTHSKLEVSVYDSLLGTWKYFSTPYYFGSIDTSKSIVGIAVFTTYMNTVNNQLKDFGFIIYDQELHQFAPKFFSNNDPDYPGASYLYAIENSVSFKTECCDVFNGHSFTAKSFLYDISRNQWIDSLKFGGGPGYFGEIIIQYGGYAHSSRDDYTFNPQIGKYFYHPPSGNFRSCSFLEPITITGNQDIITCQEGNFLTSDEVTISIYDPLSGYWPTFYSSDCEFSGDESIFYLEYPYTTTKIFGAFDDSTYQWHIDTVDYNISDAISKDRVIAYVYPGTIPKVHVQTYSPTLHVWVKDSVDATNGVNNLYITKSTVKWTDNSGTQFQMGYIDGSGWGNYPTPVQLNFKLTDMFPTMGVPMVHVRSCSYGTDSTRFYFSDGQYSEYYQGSVWHQFKVNGTYTLAPVDSMEVCIETLTDSGLVRFCGYQTFASCSVGGMVTSSDSIICSQDTVMLVLTGSTGVIQWQTKTLSGSWTNIVTPGFDNDTIYASPINTSFYRAKLVDGICPPAYSNLYSVEVVPTLIIGPITGDNDYCAGKAVSYSIDSIPGFLQFIWNFPPGFDMMNDSTSFISGIANASGMIYVHATTVCGPTPQKLLYINVLGPDTTVSYFAAGNELTSHEWNALWWQWLSCPSMTPILGATGDIFEPTVSGSYAVALSYEGCIDTSGCHDVIVTGMLENSNENITVFPNPVQHELNIQFENMQQGKYELIIMDIMGKQLINMNFRNDASIFTRTINVSSLAVGIYTLSIQSDQYHNNIRIIRSQ